MAVGPISPVAPARVRVFLVPIGPIRKASFTSFTQRLQRESSVRLGDISPDTRPGKTTFSPLAFPNGAVLYNMCTAVPPTSHSALSPFESFRETLLILGIVDANEIQSPSTLEESLPQLQRDLDQVSEQHPNSLVTKLLIFDVPESHVQKRAPAGAIYVPSPEMSRSTTMKTIMCDVSADFLGELSSFATSVQSMQTIESPAVGFGHLGNVPPVSSRSLDMIRNESLAQESRPETPSRGPEASWDNSSSTTLQSVSLQQPAVATSRPSSPANGFDSLSTAATDQDNDVRLNDEDNNSRRPRPKTMASVRDSSRDGRIQQTVSVNSTERARNRLKARQSLIIGTLHLHAGRWTDALRELVDSTTRARAFSDHLWHAKGLENILTTLLLLAWTGSDFQIPKICYPMSEKSTSIKGSALSHPVPTGSDKVAAGKRTSDDGPYQALSALLPDLVNMIVGIYTRSYSFHGEGLPEFHFSECVIRLSNLLAVVNRAGGVLSRDALQAIVLARPLTIHAETSFHPALSSFVKKDVCSLLFRAYPANTQSSGTSLRDKVSIYAGIASVLSVLGLHRKRAMVVKEMLTILVPSLIQARKVAAAEVGIHPAASLATLHGLTGEGSVLDDSTASRDESSSTFQSLLLFLCSTYGVLTEAQSSDQHMSSENGQKASVTEGLLDVIVAESVQRGFGGLNLKVDILRLCAQFSEALPNFQDVMQFTASLLRTTGPGIAPKTGSMDGLVLLAREEQVRSAAKLHRTLGVFRSTDAARLETTYWDRFLVRGINLSDIVGERRLIPIRKSELSKLTSETSESTSVSQGPFLYNPFLKTIDPNVAETAVAAKESITFEVLLQNLYDFEVIVEDIELITEGVDFQQNHQNIILGPFRIQRALLTGVATEPGELRISGCAVKFQGCSKQEFLLFPDAWAPDQEVKVKEFGRRAAHTKARTISLPKRDDENEKASPTTKPRPFVLTIPIEKEQPYLTVIGTSTSQTIVSVLEGETQTFSITVRNDSTTSIVDFVQLSFTDTTRKPLDTSDRNSFGARELYELDFVALHRQPFLWLKKESETNVEIKPGETMTFDVSVFGVPGLSKGSVYINYAYLGATLDETKSKIYTRRLCLPITVTVNPTVYLQAFDVVPIPPPLPINGDTVVDAGTLTAFENVQHGDFPDYRDTFFMLLLDLRSLAARPMAVRVRQIDPTRDESFQGVGDYIDDAGDVIQPGQTVRLALRVRKLFVEDPQMPISVLRPTSQRQHVVDGTRNAAEERALVSAFWYREKLLKGLKATWQEVNSSRKGGFDLRGISFNSQMVEVVRQDRVSLKVEIVDSTRDNTSEKTSTSNGYVVGVDDFLTVKIAIHNRTNDDLRCLLTLEPKLSFDPLGQAVDMTKRIAWNGLLKRPIKKLAPSQTIEIQIGFSVLSAGQYEIFASADSISKKREVRDQLNLDLQHIAPTISGFSKSEYGANQHLGSANCRFVVEDG